jgi:5-methylcytosine-specific restriction endonuclease McrA
MVEFNTNKQPLNPVHPGRARMLLSSGKAAVLKRYPFTIVLKTAIEKPDLQPLRIKIDPGSKTTGIAIVNDASSEVVFAAELSHRGHAIKASLDDRRAVRQSRRRRHTRYRKQRFLNRKRKEGWVPPSLESRIANMVTWVQRFRRLAPITAISQELVTFDFQQMENPEISGTEYQQGTLAGYEVREYLLEKWQRACSYCGAEHIPLQVEHINPKANGGTNRVSNLCLACEPCNKAKGKQDIRTFLAKKPALLKRILVQAQAPLKDASAVNVTRWSLFNRLKELGLPVETGSGGLTKYNRSTRELPKAHWIDAACVGKSTPDVLCMKQISIFLIIAKGHGCRQMCVTDPHAPGFPKQHKKRCKTFLGYRTGDMVKAVTPKMTIEGRIVIRHRPSFRIGKVDIHPKYMRRVQRADGYAYEQKGVRGVPPHA